MGKRSDQDDIRRVYEDIRKRIKKRYDKRKEFFGHFLSYLFVNAMIWLVLLEPSQFGDGVWGIGGALVTVGWTIGIFFHAADWLSEELVEQAVEREMERAGYRSVYQYEKAKRDERLVRLSDDGEIVDYEEDYEAAAHRRAKNE